MQREKSSTVHIISEGTAARFENIDVYPLVEERPQFEGYNSTPTPSLAEVIDTVIRPASAASRIHEIVLNKLADLRDLIQKLSELKHRQETAGERAWRPPSFRANHLGQTTKASATKTYLSGTPTCVYFSMPRSQMMSLAC